MAVPTATRDSKRGPERSDEFEARESERNWHGLERSPEGHERPVLLLRLLREVLQQVLQADEWVSARTLALVARDLACCVEIHLDVQPERHFPNGRGRRARETKMVA